jgi:acetoin utilization protein AcuC
MEKKNAAFIYTEELEHYHYPSDCPFKTERTGKTYRIIHSLGLLDAHFCRLHAPEPASRENLETFHTSEYLDVLREAAHGRMTSEGLFMGLGTSDTPVFRDMYNYAVLASGATMKGVELLLSGEYFIAFNVSGGYHHAGPSRASGFCYINDVALACLEFIRQGRSVVFLDIDAHHCDGVQDAFFTRRDVMTISMHESGETLFPGTGDKSEIGDGEGKGYTVNIQLPPGIYDEAYLRAFQELAVPLIGSFDPDVIVFEVGMDGLSGDPLTHMQLTNETYMKIMKGILTFDKPVLITGGGGYNPDNTARGWALIWAVICGGEDQRGSVMGAGGVMLESTEWLGGLRDRSRIVEKEQMRTVRSAVDSVIDYVKSRIFPLHGL